MIRNVSKATLLGSLNFNTLQIIAKFAYKEGVPHTFYTLLAWDNFCVKLNCFISVLDHTRMF